jgi:hypothetical protein
MTKILSAKWKVNGNNDDNDDKKYNTCIKNESGDYDDEYTSNPLRMRYFLQLKTMVWHCSKAFTSLNLRMFFQ